MASLTVFFTVLLLVVYINAAEDNNVIPKEMQTATEEFTTLLGKLAACNWEKLHIPFQGVEEQIEKQVTTGSGQLIKWLLVVILSNIEANLLVTIVTTQMYPMILHTVMETLKKFLSGCKSAEEVKEN